MNAQTDYEFGIINISNNNFKIVVVPNFASTGNTNISDIGFTLTIPTGSSDIINLVNILGNNWSVTKFDGATLSGAGISDGSLDVYNIKRDPASTILSHTSGQQIDLVSFDIDNMPTSGTMNFLNNSDPIAMHPAFGGGINSFYNSDIDNTAVDDYFTGYVSGMDSHTFSSLDINSIALDIDLSIYPNPTKGKLNIETNKAISYSIYNILGQSVKLKGELENSSKKSINLSHLPDGIYILKVKDDSENSKSFKIIKKE
jgi:hypothetical protein